MKTLVRLQFVVLCFVVAILAACGGGSSSGDNSTPPPAPPADTTPPTVSSKSPTAGDTGVPLNAKVSVTFSEAMTNSTLTTALTMAPTAGGAPVAANIVVNGNTATLTPSVNLAPSTPYTATVTTDAKDAAGNALAANITWSFTTGAAPDTTPPTVVSSNLTDGQAGVSDSTSIFITFSEDMALTSLNPATTFTVNGPSGAISGSINYLNPTAAFVPTVSLAGNTAYTATVTSGATDLAGNPLAAAPFNLSFTTATLTHRAFMTAPAAAGSQAGNLVLVNPSDPAATQSFPALVNASENNDDARIGYLPAGSYNATTKQVSDFHRHAVVFANGGKVFKLSTVVTGTPPVPVQISSISDITDGLGDGSPGAAAGDLCQLTPLFDFANLNNSLVVVFQAGPDKTCFTADDVTRFFLFGDSSATAPVPFPAGFSLNAVAIPGNDINTGAFDGVVAANTVDGSLVRLSGAGLATATPVANSPTGVTSMEPITQLNDGRTVLRVNKEIRVYTPGASPSIGAALFTLNRANGITSASDGTNLFFTDNPVGNTNVIQKLSFPTAGAAGALTSPFLTGTVGAVVSTKAVTPNPTGRLIFQENDGTIKSIPKAGGVAPTTLVSTTGGPVIFVGTAAGTPVRVYANVSTGGFAQGVAGSGTWTAKVVAEDGSVPVSHAGDSRWIAGTIGTTVNLFGNQRFLRQILLLTRVAADDHAATVASFNALTHTQLGNGAGTAVTNTVPADVAYLGDASNSSKTQFFAREEGGAKLLLQATYTGASGKQPDVFFIDPLKGDTLVNVGGITTTDIPLDFKDLFD